MIRQFIRHRNMSMKSLQARRTPGSRDECRTAPDGRRPLDQAHGLEPFLISLVAYLACMWQHSLHSLFLIEPFLQAHVHGGPKAAPFCCCSNFENWLWGDKSYAVFGPPCISIVERSTALSSSACPCLLLFFIVFFDVNEPVSVFSHLPASGACRENVTRIDAYQFGAGW